MCTERERHACLFQGETWTKGYVASLPTLWFTANSGSSLLSDSGPSHCGPFPSFPWEVQERSKFLPVTLGSAVASLCGSKSVSSIEWS